MIKSCLYFNFIKIVYFIYLSIIYLSIYLSIYLFVYLSFYLSICLYFYLPTYSLIKLLLSFIFYYIKMLLDCLKPPLIKIYFSTLSLNESARSASVTAKDIRAITNNYQTLLNKVIRV